MTAQRVGGAFLATVGGLLLVRAVPAQKVDWQADVEFAIGAIETQCKALLVTKKIEWRKATAPLLAESRKTRTAAAHLLLLWRLLARLQDGHAEVRPLERGKDIALDLPDRSGSPGLFLCRVGDAVYVKNSWGAAEAAGIAAGTEVVKVGGVAAFDWLLQRQARIADLVSFSTSQHGFFYTCHQGLADAPGTRLELEVRQGSAKKTRVVEYRKGSQVPNGPAFPPAPLKGDKDVFFATTAKGNGYVHVRRCKEDLPAQMDAALEGLGDVSGLVLDFRGNSGGGFDHEALFGRFLPKGTKWQVGSGYESAGRRPFGGPMVVIVDGTVRSAGETAAGMFGEDGRAYLIGESATAGMASQKTTIELPSRLFALYVSTSSNKARFQGGKGIEGVGVSPHEIVPFVPADLAAGRDTAIERAEALLAAFPKERVRYRPEEHGWAPPEGK